MREDQPCHVCAEKRGLACPDLRLKHQTVQSTLFIRGETGSLGQCLSGGSGVCLNDEVVPPRELTRSLPGNLVRSSPFSVRRISVVWERAFLFPDRPLRPIERPVFEGTPKCEIFLISLLWAPARAHVARRLPIFVWGVAVLMRCTFSRHQAQAAWVCRCRNL